MGRYRRKLGVNTLERDGPRLRGVPASSGGGSGAAPNDAEYLTLAVHADLTSERVFTPSARLTGADAGAGGAYSLDVNQGAAFAWTNVHTFSVGITFNGVSDANEITIPDNTAIAFELEDAGGLEYLRIVSTNAQSVIDFNNAAADVDFHVQAVGVADAFQVQGSDGQITLGALGAGFVQSDVGGVLSSAAIGAGDLPAHTHAIAAGNGGPLAVGTTGTGATAGSVFFAGVVGVIQQDNANLFWDNTLKSLGIRSTAPGVVAAGLYVPWVAGDATPTAHFGSQNAANARNAIDADTFAGNAITARTSSGIGILGFSVAAGVGGHFYSTTGIGAIVNLAGAGTSILDIQDNGASVWTFQDGGNLLPADGGTIGQAAGPLITFDDAGDDLQISGCDVLIDPGAGLAAPDGTLHVHTASAGAVVAGPSADDLIVENFNNGGISILTADSAIGTLAFGNPSDNLAANITWLHDSNIMVVGTANAGAEVSFQSGPSITGFTLQSTGETDFIEYIRHLGDTDTYLRFQSDQITLRAGGVDMIDIVEAGTDTITLGGSALLVPDNFIIGLGAAAGRIEFDDLATDEVNILDAKLGVGTSTPDFLVDIEDLSADPYLRVNSVSGGNTYAILTEQAANLFGGMLKYDGANNRFEIGTLNNSVEVPAIFIPRNTTTVGVNIVSPGAQTHIDQSSASGAIPVLSVDQGDISEEFINYLAASAASVANPISTWTTGNTIQGFVRVGINNTFYWMPFYDAPTS